METKVWVRAWRVAHLFNFDGEPSAVSACGKFLISGYDGEEGDPCVNWVKANKKRKCPLCRAAEQLPKGDKP